MNIENMSFDEAISKLEKNLDLLEKNENIPNANELFEESLKLKNHCEKLLNEERANFEKVAKENGISLEELGLNEENEEDTNFENNN